MANFISILRVLLAFVVIGMISFLPHTSGTYWLAFALTVIVMWMDGLDGYVARKFNLVSDFGALLDILSDRIVELTYWIAFAAWLWVPLWIPILVMTRGIAVDGLRAVAKEKGFTAFGNKQHDAKLVGCITCEFAVQSVDVRGDQGLGLCIVNFGASPECGFEFTWCCHDSASMLPWASASSAACRFLLKHVVLCNTASYH